MKNKVIYIFAVAFLLVGCNFKADPSGIEENLGLREDLPIISFINEEGITLESRIQEPNGFMRVEAVDGSLAEYIRNLTLKPHDSPVLLYDGQKKGYDEGHIAVFNFDIGTVDLQQCADSIIRVYAEYLWSLEAYDRIEFHLTNGFFMEYTKWREGNRIEVQGNNVRWIDTESFDDTYECFRNYLTKVYIYAGTISLSQESQLVSLEDIQIGDFFMKAGSPGHCALVVDLAKDSEGEKCFLLAQGYMPAQDFHILNNPLHLEDPWYYLEELKDYIKTPEYIFEKDNLMRWNGFM
ncbi:MAG: DUF4846 domain-containing protein [Peptostreptococcales bacterium]